MGWKRQDTSFHRICRRIPSHTSASWAFRFIRRIRRRILSTVDPSTRQHVFEQRGDAFEIGRRGGAAQVGFGDGRRRAADDFVQTHGDGLAQIHRPVLLTRGDAQQPVAMAHVVIGQAEFF
jgi:hypothetical protein